MGQEFLEVKPWDTNPGGPNLLDWAVLNGGDKVLADHLRFTQELVQLRTSQPALRSDNVHPYYICDADRVLAFHRWLPTGQDVVVVATLAESTWWSYQLGFPLAGFWREAFNSDVYDNWVNPWVAGNGGGVQADGPPMHGFTASASLVIPANGIVVFTRS
jgi:1,4-alpha-glucan branching enzyme